ncbi:MAG TPA: PAS domain S-box protein [Desulfobacterales bacterium]|nr:PAS domain S-box protein [Desulfobacterales bacterium]
MTKAVLTPIRSSRRNPSPQTGPSTEKVLKISEEKCTMILENIQEGYYEVDLDGNYTFFNEGLLRLTGYSREEMLGLNFSSLVDEYNRKKVFKVFNQVYLTGVPAHAFDWECIHKEGAHRFVEASISLKKDGDNNSIGFMGIARNITERKLAEQALRESEERYRTIIENIQDGYYEVDLDGNYTFFNEGLLRITGYSREEMLGLNNRRIVDEFNNRKVFKVFNHVYLTGVPAHAFDWECIRKDGARRFVEVSVTLKRDIYGKPVGFMGISRDITERKRYQSELEAKENELKHKNQSLAEANTALNVLMKKVEEHRMTNEETLRNNLIKFAMPYLQKAREKTRDKAALDNLRLLEESLNSIFAPFAHDLAQNFPRLTSTEIDVVNFIVQGKRTKEIADVLSVTPKAIEVHRNNLRRKFGLIHQKTGLRTHLLSLG